MTAETFSYMPKQSNKPPSNHKQKPAQESAECIAGDIHAVVIKHIRNFLGEENR